MQETGIVRRIDELGRVVVPKEIRKTLRIREGDPLEIYLDKDRLVLKKYSPVNSVSSLAVAVANGIEEVLGKKCLITDTDNVLYISKGKQKELIGRSISKQMEEVLESRKSVNESNVDGGTVIPLYDNDDFQYENQIIVPIISAGDCFGSVVIFDNEKSQKFSTNDLKIVQLGATFLSKQFD